MTLSHRLKLITHSTTPFATLGVPEWFTIPGTQFKTMPQTCFAVELSLKYTQYVDKYISPELRDYSVVCAVVSKSTNTCILAVINTTEEIKPIVFLYATKNTRFEAFQACLFEFIRYNDKEQPVRYERMMQKRREWWDRWYTNLPTVSFGQFTQM